MGQFSPMANESARDPWHGFVRPHSGVVRVVASARLLGRRVEIRPIVLVAHLVTPPAEDPLRVPTVDLEVIDGGLPLFAGTKD